MAKTKTAKDEAKAEELPSNPIEFARELKRLISEDFAKSYRSVKRLVIKH